MTALVVALGWSPAATAEPDLETAKSRLAQLNRQAEAASERYNDARVKHAEARLKLAALNADLVRQRRLVEGMRSEVAVMVVDQFQGASLSTTSQVVLSDNPDDFLDSLTAVSAYNSQQAQAMDRYAVELERLALRQDAVREEARRLAAIKDSLAAEKKERDQNAAAARELVNELEVDQRAALVEPAWNGPLPKVASSGRGAAAVRFALAQVGKQYNYGAAGPNAYDCSGLTMRAWEAAGVALPHSSAAQYSYGTRIPESQLQPGDLVFYYSPISHVGIYIGNGLIANAQTPATDVAIAGLHSMPYVGAVRPG